MKKAVRLRSQAGFSLIELMIVVAIIGILATIAIPNFQRFQAKAKQTEAKTNLAALHSAMKAFHSEWNTYYGDFRDIGFDPQGRLNYHVGFAGSGTAPNAPFQPSNRGGATVGACFNSSVASCGFRHQTVSGIPAFTVVTAQGCGQNSLRTTPNGTEFTATAYGNLNTGSGVNDQWSIDQDKVLCNHTPESI